MPLLLGYLSSLNDAKIGHITKAFYALENFLENLGEPKNDLACRRLVFFSYLATNTPSPPPPSDLHFPPWPTRRTGEDIESYLPTLMETMLSTLNTTENLKIKELTVSAIGGIGETNLTLHSASACRHLRFQTK